MSNAGDGDGQDADPTDPGDESNPDGTSSFHGTHVAGILAGDGSDSQDEHYGTAHHEIPMRIEALRGELGFTGEIEMDGGIDPDTISSCAEAGTNFQVKFI